MLATRAGLPDCRPLLADPGDLSLAFQPVVDLASAAVAGYEALARFPGTAGAGVWFGAARAAGLEAELAALVLHRALAALSRLPAGTFLSVGISTRLLGDPALARALASRPRLTGLALRLTGDGPDAGSDSGSAAGSAAGSALAAWRERGAVVLAEGWPAAERLRPDLVSMRRVGTGRWAGHPLGVLSEVAVRDAGRAGARVVAEDLEAPADLVAAVRLGVPLGRGWLLGPPSPSPAPLSPTAGTLVRSHAARARRDRSVARFVRPVRSVQSGDPAGVPPVVVTGADGDPVALVIADRTGGIRTTAAWPLVASSASVDEALEAALARPVAERGDPLLCTSATGELLGLLRVPDLTAAR